jgi:hypothetical protein
MKRNKILLLFGFAKQAKFFQIGLEFHLVWCFAKRSGGILFMQSTTWLFCSAGNHPPAGSPGLKPTRTDKILLKF